MRIGQCSHYKSQNKQKEQFNKLIKDEGLMPVV